MAKFRIDSEEDALFSSNSSTNPYPIYYVQSPSAFSLDTPIHIIHHSHHHPSPSPCIPPKTLESNPSKNILEASLSRYSSSRGSTNSFLHERKTPNYEEEEDQVDDGSGFTIEELEKFDKIITDRIRNNSINIEDEDYDDYDETGDQWWRQWLTFNQSSTCGWKVVQIGWRFLLSLVVALVVFYVLTKPPPPKLSIKVAGIPEFELNEGVDGSGVSTKVLSCNCSLNLMIDNKSMLFALHIHSSTIQMAFARLPFALAQGQNLQAGPSGKTNFKLFVGARNKLMYGAGRSMQELLESKNGLPLVIHVTLSSSFHVVWGLIKPKYHHQIHCFILLSQEYDNKNKTQKYISTCKIIL